MRELHARGAFNYFLRFSTHTKPAQREAKHCARPTVLQHCHSSKLSACVAFNHTKQKKPLLRSDRNGSVDVFGWFSFLNLAGWIWGKKSEKTSLGAMLRTPYVHLPCKFLCQAAIVIGFIFAFTHTAQRTQSHGSHEANKDRSLYLRLSSAARNKRRNEIRVWRSCYS